MPTFTYSDGKVASEDWSYDIKATFDSQLKDQPQYRRLEEIHTPSGVPSGAYHVANMSTGLADDDYRAKQGILPTVVGQWPSSSDFAVWLEESDGTQTNRQRIWNDAAVWFTE